MAPPASLLFSVCFCWSAASPLQLFFFLACHAVRLSVRFFHSADGKGATKRSPAAISDIRRESSGPSLASCLLPISMRALLARPLTLDLDLVHLLLRSTQVSCLSFHPSPLHSSPRVPGFPSPNRHAAIASKIWPAHLAPLRRILLNQLLLACILRILPRVGL